MTLFQCGAFSLVLLLIGSLNLRGADIISNWDGGSGNWSSAGQWTPSAVPNNSNGHSYDVTVSNGTATLDVSPTINSLSLNGTLGEGYDSSGSYTILTVNKNAVVNGSIGPHGAFAGWLDSLIIGGNLSNNGTLIMGSMLSVGGNMNNSGSVNILQDSLMSGLFVGGKVVNTGTLQFGSNDGVDTGVGGFGTLVNRGSIFLSPGSALSAGAVTDIPKGASWFTSGALSGFSSLNRAAGTLEVQGTIGPNGMISPLIVGSPGKTINNSGFISIGSGFGPSVVNFLGNLSNTGAITVGSLPPREPYGVSTLNVAGTLTNRVNGTLDVNNPYSSLAPSPGSLNVGTLVNYGTATFQGGTTSTAQRLENSGSLTLFNDQVSGVGSLSVGTLKLDAGNIVILGNSNGVLLVGSGAAPAGFTGYEQFANGVLDLAGGTLTSEGAITLDGTLDIMLGNGEKPIGSVFTVVGGEGDIITGTFSKIEGLVFDGGRERYAITYQHQYGEVYLTVEQNTTPEPGSLFLAFAGFAGIFGVGVARKRSQLRLLFRG